MSNDKPFQIDQVTNQERLMVQEQLVALGQEGLELYTLNVCSTMLKAIHSRELLSYALVEHLVNTGQNALAARVICGLAIQSAQMAVRTKLLIESDKMGITEVAKKAILERISASEMGFSTIDLKTMLGEMPEF